jgi:hypothetical protein
MQFFKTQEVEEVKKCIRIMKKIAIQRHRSGTSKREANMNLKEGSGGKEQK